MAYSEKWPGMSPQEIRNRSYSAEKQSALKRFGREREEAARENIGFIS
jgi:hypothetical protein